jgi:hypothetical protein
MYEHRKRFILTALPALAGCPPDILPFIRKWTTILIILARPPSVHFVLTDRIIGENVNIWNDTDISTLLAND